MGYVLKTTFWLGLVLTSMPLGETLKVSDVLTPDQQAAACAAAGQAIAARAGSAADAYRGLAAMGCATLAATPAPAIAQTPLRGAELAPGLHALTENDRKPPWLGPPLPPTRPKSG
jgi:hypothetical protein